MTTMRADVWGVPDRIRVVRLDRPEPPAESALVRVSYAGLCGTELAILHGQHRRATPPLVLGHELAGVVSRSGAAGLDAGQLVAARPLISCGSCWACRHGAAHACRRLALYGIDASGGLAEYVALPVHLLHPLPDRVDHRVAVLTEPLAVAVGAVARTRVSSGATVAVFGGGPIGVPTALLVARLDGAGGVLLVEPNPRRRPLAADVDLVALPGVAALRRELNWCTGGEGADVTFGTLDAAGHSAAADELADLTRSCGTIVNVGVYKAPAALDLRRVNFAEQTVLGVQVYAPDDFGRAVRLVVDDAPGLHRLPLRVFGLDGVRPAFDEAHRGDGDLKVLVRPGTAR